MDGSGMLQSRMGAMALLGFWSSGDADRHPLSMWSLASTRIKKENYDLAFMEQLAENGAEVNYYHRPFRSPLQ